MKRLSLILVMVVLLVGFAFAEANDTLLEENQTDQINSSVENDSVVVIENVEINETDILNETVVNETDLVNETVVESEVVDDLELGDDIVIEDVVIEDVVIEDERVVEDKESAFDVVVSYGSSVIDRVNAVHENLFYVLIIVLWVLLLFLHSAFFAKKSAADCFAKASSLHRRAQQAHVNGDYEKAKKLYAKSYSLREEGERKVESEL